MNKVLSEESEMNRESISPISMVAESSEYQYGAEMFEAIMDRSKIDNIAEQGWTKAVPAKQTGKSR